MEGEEEEWRWVAAMSGCRGHDTGVRKMVFGSEKREDYIVYIYVEL